jgi:hypothetical protein
MEKCQMCNWEKVMSINDCYKLKDQYSSMVEAKYSFKNELTNDIYKTKRDLQRLVEFETSEFKKILNSFSQKYNVKLVV